MVVPSPDDVYWVWRDAGSSSSDCSPLWGWRLQQLRRVKYHSESGEFVVEAGRYIHYHTVSFGFVSLYQQLLGI